MYYGWYGEGYQKRCVRYNTDANGNIVNWTTVNSINCTGRTKTPTMPKSFAFSPNMDRPEEVNVAGATHLTETPPTKDEGIKVGWIIAAVFLLWLVFKK